MLHRAHLLTLAGVFLSLCTGPLAAFEGDPPSVADYPSADVTAAETKQRLELPTGLPDQFDVVIRIDDATHVLHLVRHTLRAAGFRARAYLADGRMVEVTPDRPATYRGHVVDQPMWPVVADLRPEGLNARVFSDGGATWKIRTLPGQDRSSGGALHVIGAEQRPSTIPRLDESPLAASLVGVDPGTGEGSAGFRHAGQHVAEIAFDLAHPFYEAAGSTIPGAIAGAEAILNDVDFFFARDALITHTITEIIVRTAPFYPTGGAIFEAFISEWNANQTHISRDLAHLLTESGGFGGVARASSVCDLTRAYAYSSGGSEVTGHEVAHNWGADHCHDYWPCNAVCDSCLNLGLKTRDIILAYRDSVTCLDEGGGYPVPLPPFAYPDVVDLTRDELAAGATRAFDVLANDHDGNLDPLSIDEFDPVGKFGGTLVLSEGTGADGRDELIYTTPASLIPGDDPFQYTVGDGMGLQAKGYARLHVAAPGLVGCWKLDGTASDSSGGARDGTTAGGTPVWIPGVHGQALQFDGINDYIRTGGLNRDTPSVTFATWLRRNGDQIGLAGVVVTRGPNTHAGLNFGTTNELRYHWNDDPAASGWDSGLVPPDGQWVLVALVVEPQQATIYMYDGVTLQSSVNPIVHPVQNFDKWILIGGIPGEVPLHFRGALDEVRIYNHALGPADIVALHDLGGKAHAPTPPDGGRMLPGTRELSWLRGLGAWSHDVYFGADYEAVRDATPASPEFLGNTMSTVHLAPPPLFEGVTYAWRVDEVTPGGTVKGDVWLFSVESWLARWPLDEQSGTTAGSAGGGLDGTYLGSPNLGERAARPELVHSVDLDGVDDSVELPPLHLDRNEVGFSVWVRRNGPQVEDAGILITRSESTIAGLNVDSGGALGYKWNDQGSVFGPSFSAVDHVLPDNEWVFVALVIAPDKTTAYLGSQGVLSRIDIFTPNGPEEFDGPLYLGQDPIGGRHFRGSLDDFRIHDHALSFAEVAALHATGFRAGRVPDGADQPGTPLQLDMLAGDEVLLTWSLSCMPFDSDYSIYEGEIGDFASHLPAACTTGGATSAMLQPQTGDRYFLVVPASTNREGSYGVDASGQPRSASAAACRVQYVTGCP